MEAGGHLPVAPYAQQGGVTPQRLEAECISTGARGQSSRDPVWGDRGPGRLPGSTEAADGCASRALMTFGQRHPKRTNKPLFSENPRFPQSDRKEEKRPD